MFFIFVHLYTSDSRGGGIETRVWCYVVVAVRKKTEKKILYWVVRVRRECEMRNP